MTLRQLCKLSNGYVHATLIIKAIILGVHESGAVYWIRFRLPVRITHGECMHMNHYIFGHSARLCACL